MSFIGLPIMKSKFFNIKKKKKETVESFIEGIEIFWNNFFIFISYEK